MSEDEMAILKKCHKDEEDRNISLSNCTAPKLPNCRLLFMWKSKPAKGYMHPNAILTEEDWKLFQVFMNLPSSRISEKFKEIFQQ